MTTKPMIATATSAVALRLPEIRPRQIAVQFGQSLLYLTGSISLVLLVWAAIAAWATDDLPGPTATLQVFWELIHDPFYDNGPNDKGIGVQLWASLQRVFAGFAVGTLIAVPVGVAIGISGAAHRLLDPLVQIMRPVSPLAWFPIGLAMFQAVQEATIFMIIITSLWPTMINTAFGVAAIPKTHKNVARVFQFSRRTYLLRIILPATLPYMFTGMRLSMGIAWMVIVAGEMLSGGTGIGFFVWDSWNALDLERVISAIILIGAVGFALDRMFSMAHKRLAYTEAS